MSPAILAKGVVLAFNYIPSNIEPNIAKFWAQATASLAQRGFLLIVATTAPLSEPGINSIDVPFFLPEFCQRYPQVELNTHFDEAWVEKLQTWYRCDEEVAIRTATVAEKFYTNLFEALGPCAVLTWQSTHPKSQLLQGLARKSGIPVWNAERGWLRNTLMMDLAQNTYLNELQTSFALSQCIDLVPVSEEDYQALRERALGGTLTGRYESAAVVSPDILRTQYDIPVNARLFAFFMHGEPFLLRDANPLATEFHQLSLDGLETQIESIAAYCERTGTYLLVQDHPFNNTVGLKLRLSDSKHIVPVQENIHTILNAAALSFFTTSTIQYDAIFYAKPYGVLCRTSADVADGAYSALEYATVYEFIQAVELAEDWEHRHAKLRHLITFLSKTMLFDITEEGRQASVDRFAAHLSRFVRPVDEALPARIDQFLATWQHGR